MGIWLLILGTLAVLVLVAYVASRGSDVRPAGGRRTSTWADEESSSLSGVHAPAIRDHATRQQLPVAGEDAAPPVTDADPSAPQGDPPRASGS